MPVTDWEQVAYDEFKKRGTLLDKKGDTELNKKIRILMGQEQAAQKLKNLLQEIGGLSKLDNRSLALIIEGSECQNVVAYYVDMEKLFGGINNFLKERTLLVQAVQEILDSPDYSAQSFH